MTRTQTSNDRRQPADRRAQGDRRRQAEGRYVTIEICRTELHVAIVAPQARGEGSLLLCRSHRWRVEADSLLTRGGAEELRIAFKQLVVEERLSGAATKVLLNNDLCVSRVAIGSSSAVEEQISELTERSQLYLALGAGEKAAATARFPLDARHEHAVLSVANQRTVSAVVEAAESAGLDLMVVEASAVALCRAHGELYDDDEPVILAQIEEGGVEIALSHKGRLLLEHRPGGRIAPEQLADILKQHHGRLVRYCQHQRIGGDTGLTKAYLTGDIELIDVAAKRLGEDSPLTAERFDTRSAAKHWKVRDSAPETNHAAVLGGALEGPDSVSRSGPNLLERWIAESRKHIRPMLIRSAAPIVATLLIAAGLWLTNLEQARYNAGLSEQLATLTPARIEADRLRLRLLQDTTKIKQLRKLDEQTPPSQLTLLLERVAGCLPNDVWLDKLQLVDGNAMVISGASYTDSGAYDFVSHLNNAPQMHKVALQETSAGAGPKGPVTTFRIKATYHQHASGTQPDDSVASSAAASRNQTPTR